MQRSFLIGIAACASLVAAGAAHAAPTFDFEGLPFGTGTPFTVTSGGLSATFAGPADIDPGAFGIATNFPTATGYLYRLMSGDFLSVGTAFGAIGSTLTITFDRNVTSLAFAFALDDPADTTALTATTNTGAAFRATGALAAGYAYPEATAVFASPTPFTSITFASDAIDFSLDDVAVAAVPEPAVGWLAAAGIVPWLLIRRRRTSSSRRIG